QDLPVDFDRRLLEAGDKSAVRQTVLAGRRVDADDPQVAELALALTAVAVGVLTRPDHRLLGDLELSAAGTVVALRLLQYLLATGAGCDATLHSRHGSFLLSAPWSAASDRCVPRRPAIPWRGRATDAYAWTASWSGCDSGSP